MPFANVVLRILLELLDLFVCFFCGIVSLLVSSYIGLSQRCSQPIVRKQSLEPIIQRPINTPVIGK